MNENCSLNGVNFRDITWMTLYKLIDYVYLCPYFILSILFRSKYIPCQYLQRKCIHIIQSIEGIALNSINEKCMNVCNLLERMNWTCGDIHKRKNWNELGATLRLGSKIYKMPLKTMYKIQSSIYWFFSSWFVFDLFELFPNRTKLN